MAEKIAAISTSGSKITLKSELGLIESLATAIQEFKYDAETSKTLEPWYKQYEDVFLVDVTSLDETTKVHPLIQNWAPRSRIAIISCKSTHEILSLEEYRVTFC